MENWARQGPVYHEKPSKRVGRITFQPEVKDVTGIPLFPPQINRVFDEHFDRRRFFIVGKQRPSRRIQDSDPGVVIVCVFEITMIETIDLRDIDVRTPNVLPDT